MTLKSLVKDFDYVGLLLFSATMVLLLVGLNWGGVSVSLYACQAVITVCNQVLYPWSSAYVLGTLLSGAVCLIAFALYESLVGLKEPYLPVELLKNFQFTSCAVWCAIAAMTFYAFG